MPRNKIDSLEKLEALLDADGNLSRAVFQDLDLTTVVEPLKSAKLRHAIFLGCTIPAELNEPLLKQGRRFSPKSRTCLTTPIARISIRQRN